mgnify:CR=1 FL=1
MEEVKRRLAREGINISVFSKYHHISHRLWRVKTPNNGNVYVKFNFYFYYANYSGRKC